MIAEPAYAPNPAMTASFQIGCHWRRVGDTFRWAFKAANTMACALTLLSALFCIQLDAQSSFSPDLTKFLLDHPATSLVLSNAFATVSAVRSVELYYFYTQDESLPLAHHNYLGDSSTLGIFVRENEPPCDQCISTLFELLNSKGERRFRELWKLASSGGISKVDFAREMLRQEFQAVKATRDLIRKFDLKPEEIAESKSYAQFRQSPENFQEFLAYSQKLSRGGDQRAYEELYARIRKTAASWPNPPAATNPATAKQGYAGQEGRGFVDHDR